jgi:hypothetical protein
MDDHHDHTNDPLLVLLRGSVAGLLWGGGTGLALGALLAGPFGLVYGAWFGGIAGLLVGVPSAVLLAVLSPGLRSEEPARLVSLVVAGMAGAVALLVGGSPWWFATVFGGVCGAIGALAGRWVVLGRQQATSRVELRR